MARVGMQPVQVSKLNDRKENESATRGCPSQIFEFLEHYTPTG